MEDLKNIKKTLIATIQSQLGNLDCVDTQEMGAVIDMIKDLEEACYYHTIVEAMESDSEQVRYYKEMSYYPNPKYDRDRYQQDKPYKMY